MISVIFITDRTNYKVKPQIYNPIHFLKSYFVLYFWRLLIAYYAQDFDKSVLLMNNHLTIDVPPETLLQPDNPWIMTESDVKPYIFKHLDNIKLSR